MALGREGAAIAKGEALAYLESHNKRCPCFRGGIVQTEQRMLTVIQVISYNCFHKLIQAAGHVSHSHCPTRLKQDAPDGLWTSQFSRLFQARDIILLFRAQRMGL